MKEDAKGAAALTLQLVERVEVLGVALPLHAVDLPLDAGVDGFGRDVFNSFEQVDHEIAIFLAAGSRAHAAVAHHDGGHPAGGGGREERVPHALGVLRSKNPGSERIPAQKEQAVETYEVRVHVRPAGHDVAVGDVDLLRALDVEARADGEDLAVLDGDIAHEGGSALRTDGAQLEERPESVMGFAERGGRRRKTPSTRGGGLGARAKG